MTKIWIISYDPVVAQKNHIYHRKEHQKLWGITSSMKHLMNLITRYHCSKGVRESEVEEPPLGSLAATCYLEESASHHFINFIFSWFSSFWKSVSVFLMVPLSHMKMTYTIGKSIKNYGDQCRNWNIWWTWSLDNMGQRAPGNTKWRNTSWAILRPPLPTWRRVLRTIEKPPWAILWTPATGMRMPRTIHDLFHVIHEMWHGNHLHNHIFRNSVNIKTYSRSSEITYIHSSWCLNII